MMREERRGNIEGEFSFCLASSNEDNLPLETGKVLVRVKVDEAV